MGLFGRRGCAEMMQTQAEHLTRIRVIDPKTIINSNDNLQNFPNKPLGLVFWQGRRWSKATTLPQSAAKMQPLRVGLSKCPLIGV